MSTTISSPPGGEDESRTALHKSENTGCVAIPASGSRRPYFYIVANGPPSGERERHPIHKNIRMVGGRKAAGEGETI